MNQTQGVILIPLPGRKPPTLNGMNIYGWLLLRENSRLPAHKVFCQQRLDFLFAHRLETGELYAVWKEEQCSTAT